MAAFAQRAAITGQSLPRLHKDQYAQAHEDTPLGSLCKEMQVPQEAGQAPATIEYMCPLAFMWKACQVSKALFMLLHAMPRTEEEAQPVLRLRIAMYLDDVVPGNTRRPDAGRSYVAVYWTLLDLPDWLQHSCEGWFTLAYVPKRLWSKIPGQQSMLMQCLLKAFWPDTGLSLETGVVLENEGSVVMVKASEVTLWLLDGDAVSKVTLAKTMSAFKCCCKCRNVVARVKPSRIPAGPPFKT